MRSRRCSSSCRRDGDGQDRAVARARPERFPARRSSAPIRARSIAAWISARPRSPRPSGRACRTTALTWSIPTSRSPPPTTSGAPSTRWTGIASRGGVRCWWAARACTCAPSPAACLWTRPAVIRHVARGARTAAGSRRLPALVAELTAVAPSCGRQNGPRQSAARRARPRARLRRRRSAASTAAWLSARSVWIGLSARFTGERAAYRRPRPRAIRGRPHRRGRGSARRYDAFAALFSAAATGRLSTCSTAGSR